MNIKYKIFYNNKTKELLLKSIRRKVNDIDKPVNPHSLDYIIEYYIENDTDKNKLLVQRPNKLKLYKKIDKQLFEKLYKILKKYCNEHGLYVNKKNLEIFGAKYQVNNILPLENKLLKLFGFKEISEKELENLSNYILKKEYDLYKKYMKR